MYVRRRPKHAAGKLGCLLRWASQRDSTGSSYVDTGAPTDAQVTDCIVYLFVRVCVCVYICIYIDR